MHPVAHGAVLGEREQFAGMIPAACGLDRDTLRDHAGQILQCIAAEMLKAQAGAGQVAKSRGPAHRSYSAETVAEAHGAGCYATGFDLDQVVSEYRALCVPVIRLWGSDWISRMRPTSRT